jgi:hypothetical protein
MDIRIAYHPSSDTLMNRISDLLKANGISAQINPESSAVNDDVRITFVKEKSIIAPSLLDSSFVHTEQQPGY